MKTYLRVSITILLNLLMVACSRDNPLVYSTDMVLIPGGVFEMGTDTSQALYLSQEFPRYCDISWFHDQFPKHKVKVDSFFVDKYEVTFEEYRKFVEATKYKSEGNWQEYLNILSDTLKMKEILSQSDYQIYLQNIKDIGKFPIVGVSWNDASEYCRWKDKRLPTEAEWEYIARGQEKNLEYPWGMSYDSTKANIQKKIGPKPVGSYQPNSYGVYDLGGNASEWCFDFYDENYYKKQIYNNPKGPENGERRVVRGGTWYLNGPFYARSATRYTVKLDTTYSFLVGFRCAKSVKK